MDYRLKWIGGATVIITIGQLKIAVDPVLCPKGTIQDYFWFKSARLEDPIFASSDFEDIDLWLITHDHEDHLDDIGISYISKTSKIISNPNGSKKLLKNNLNNIRMLRWGQSTTSQIKEYRIEVEAIPAIHGINPLSAILAGRGNGYYLKIWKADQELYIYITGDMVYKKKTIKALQGKKVDLLIANMGAAQQGSWIMTLTLNAEMLKKMIGQLHPTTVIPVHFGTFEHYKEPVEEVKALQDQKIQILDTGDWYDTTAVSDLQ